MVEHDHVTATNTQVDATIAPDRTAVAMPNDPEAARMEIERTRARMSDTIDEIEDVLTRKKERIEQKLDVLAPVREQPLKVLGAVFGVGLVLGLLTGGDDEEDEDGWEKHHNFLHERSDTWESRARRLLRIAEEQEAELELLRARVGLAGDEEEVEEATSSRPGRARDDVAEQATGMVSRYVEQMIRRAFGA